jgi:hypothetical protein
MMKIERHGKQIALSFDPRNPLDRETLQAIAESLRKRRLTAELRLLQQAMEEPPEIDPGG